LQISIEPFAALRADATPAHRPQTSTDAATAATNAVSLLGPR
jgi:hypothetical protein